MVQKHKASKINNQLFFLFFLVVAPSYSFAADHNSSGGAAAAAAGAQTDIWPGKEEGFAQPISDAEKPAYAYHGHTYAQMMEAFEEAPDDARKIVHHLKNPFSPDWRTATFVGPSGTLKTTTALAIPHLANWHLTYIPAAHLLGSDQDTGKKRLKAILSDAFKYNNSSHANPHPRKKTVLIIDDLYVMLRDQGAESVKMYLSKFLDKQVHNKDFFFIAILNSESSAEDPLKYHLLQVTIDFPLIKDPIKLLRMFKNQISRNPDLVLNDECTDDFFNKCIKLLLDGAKNGLSPRDFNSIRLLVSMNTHALGSEERKRTVKPEHILAATRKILPKITRPQ